MTPFLGFTPDVDPTTPGAITDCVQLIPNERAMVAAPSPVDAVPGLPALPAVCRGAAVLQKTSGTRRTLAGTQTAIYEVGSGTWNNVGATYTGSSDNRWMFAQFGDTSLATNDIEAIQYATATTFAPISGAPKARILIATQNFAVAMNTQDATGSATYGDSPDRWWCSAFQDPTDWTPALATQCATERVIGAGGEITAGAPFGDGFVAYKLDEMFLAIYARGQASVFQLTRVPGDQGCVGPEAVDDIGGAHVFVGADNIWLFDGSRPVPISGGIKRWFFSDLSQAFRHRTIVRYDQTNSRIWVFYPSVNSTGAPDSVVVYHLQKQVWGRANRTIEAALKFYAPGVTWDTLGDVAATWDALPSVSWDSPFWQAAGRALAIFDTDHELKALTGGGEDSSLTTGDIGDDDQVSFVRNVRLRFFSEPTTGSVTGQTKTGAGAAAAAGGAGTLANSKFAIRQSGRFHRFAFSFTGNHETGGINVDATRAGGR